MYLFVDTSLERRWRMAAVLFKINGIPTGTKGGERGHVTSFCLTQLNDAQIIPGEVATNAALVQPAALQGDVEGVGHLME